jgi:hypothetical protein
MIKIYNTKLCTVLKKTINPRFHRGFFRFYSWVVALIIAMSSQFFISCNELDEIGLDLIESPLTLKSTDTTTVFAYTQIEDSLLANQADLNLLGFINDPVFGKTRASIYTEAFPRAIPPNFVDIHPDSLVIDSVVLSLAYVGYFGDITLPQHIRVYELNDTIPRDSIFSNRVLAVKRELEVINPEFIPNPTDTVFVGLDSIPLPAHLRVRLNNDFAQQFFDDREELEEMTIYDQFRGYFKGLFITVEELEQPGAMLYFNLSSTVSRIQFFYRKTGVANNHSFEMILGDPTGRRYTHYDNFDHAFASDPIRAQIIEGDTLLGDSLLFVQSMSNYRVKIRLPYVSDFIDNTLGDIAINSARLIIPVDDLFLEDTLEIAQVLILFREDPERPGVLTNLDDQFIAPGYFGGSLNEDAQQYTFNITQHLQQIIDDPSKNTPLYLRVSASIQNAGRVVLKGPGRDDPMRLEIKYTHPSNN